MPSADMWLLLATFVILALAAEWIGRGAKWIGLPVITGFLLAGVLTGPYVLALITPEQVLRLRFVDEIALAFIAFAAGAELVYREIKAQLKRIWWITFGIIVSSYSLVVPILSSLGETAPFLDGMGQQGRLAVGLITGAILVSRSPSSLIALVAELRARGPFTRLLMGVTVALDVVVIMLFAISTSVADVLLRDADFHLTSLLLVLFELAIAMVVGAIVATILPLALRFGRNVATQGVLILTTGLGVYSFSRWLRETTHHTGPFELFLEPLLVCMVAGFVVGNFSRFRTDFHRVLKAIGPIVYLAFFTLAGASLDLSALRLAWRIALILLVVRLVAITIGSYLGGVAGGVPKSIRRRMWMGLVTQAGIGLGLAKEVAVDFPEWGTAFATTIIAIIVVNQVVGPPMNKFVLRSLGEARSDLAGPLRGSPRALIFGMDGQSWALARQLADHGWRPAVVSRRDLPTETPPGIEILRIEALSAEELRGIGADKARTLIGLMSQDDNLELCRISHDELGVSNVVVRVASQETGAQCQKYGAVAIDPNVALVNVLDHFVRSPSLTGMVVGMDADRDIIEVEVQSEELKGTALRDLRLPLDVLVLSVRRDGASLISHGYTRLERGDLVTIMGRRQSLEQIEAKLAD